MEKIKTISKYTLNVLTIISTLILGINAVEGITSKDGRILGKMAHSERSYRGNIINVPGNMDQKLFESGIEYFK